MKDYNDYKLKAYRVILIMLIFTILASVSYVYAKSTHNPLENKTVANIHIAYVEEINAQIGYHAYAKQAKKEGFTRVASLYRTLERAEKVHAKKHLALLKAAGVKPNPTRNPLLVKSTMENLLGSLKVETYENQSMYPQFAEQALQDNYKSAFLNFQISGAAEGAHTKVLQMMIDSPDSWKEKSKGWYVCLNCGNILTARPDKCPICANPGKSFKKMI